MLHYLHRKYRQLEEHLRFELIRAHLIIVLLVAILIVLLATIPELHGGLTGLAIILLAVVGLLSLGTLLWLIRFNPKK